MSDLNYHYGQKKTKLQLDLEKYYQTVQTYDRDRVQKELEKINNKLIVPYIDYKTYSVKHKDISKNATERNRLYNRKLASGIAKWVGYVIQKKGYDFSSTWNLINATFASGYIHPDFSDDRLVVDEGMSFMDKLSLDGLVMYKKYLTSIANSVLYEGYGFDVSVRSAKRVVLALNDRQYDDHFYSDAILPKNWQTYYKYAMQQKACLDRIKNLDASECITK